MSHKRDREKRWDRALWYDCIKTLRELYLHKYPRLAAMSPIEGVYRFAKVHARLCLRRPEHYDDLLWGYAEPINYKVTDREIDARHRMIERNRNAWRSPVSSLSSARLRCLTLPYGDGC